MSRGKSINPLIVVVSGGGPVGLTFSLHLTMMMGKNAKIIIYEGRWFVDNHGKTRWQDEEQGKTRRDQVVTLQDHVINQMPDYIRQGLFKNINERVWPTSRNIPIKEVEDRLFDLLTPFVQNGQIELISENLHEQSDCLIKGNFDVLVGADGSNSFVRRYCNIQMISEGVEYACGVAYNIPQEIPRTDEPLHQALNCILTVSQTRYLVNSSTSRRGYLNIRLINDEYTELRERLQKFQSSNEPLDLLDYNKCPKSPVWTIIRQGLDFFQIPYKYVFRVLPIEINVRHASVVVRELRYEVTKTGSDQSNNEPEEKEYKTVLAFLAGDAAMNVHFWPGRGMNSGMKAAMALARNIVRSCTTNHVIHIRTPLKFLDFLDYEGFMARLRAREQQGRSLRILSNPIDKLFDASWSYADANKCYHRYTARLVKKLKETRQRLQTNSDWPHKTNVTDEELQSASTRISPEAVAQLSLVNPWPTREMSGADVFVEDVFAYDISKFLPIPTTTQVTTGRPATLKTSSRFVILWIIGEKKSELIDTIIQDIQKSPNFIKTTSNLDAVYELNTVKTIEQMKEWISSNRELIRKSDVRFKVITLWKINDIQTAVDVIRNVRSEVSRAPILIFTNRREDVQQALEYPNVMETDMEYELKEFVGINQETQWNAGCSIKTTVKEERPVTPKVTHHPQKTPTSSLPYPSPGQNPDEPSLPPLPGFMFPSSPIVPLQNSTVTTPIKTPGFISPLQTSAATSSSSKNPGFASPLQNPTTPSSSSSKNAEPATPLKDPALRPILIWFDLATNDSITVKELQTTNPNLEIVFQPTFKEAEAYLREHLREIEDREKAIIISRGYFAQDSKTYVHVGQLLDDLYLESAAFAVYTRNRKELLEKTPNPSNKYQIFERSKELIAFVNQQLKR